MNTKRENIRDGRPIVLMISFMTDKTKLILALMTNGLKSKLFRTKRHPPEWASRVHLPLSKKMFIDRSDHSDHMETAF